MPAHDSAQFNPKSRPVCASGRLSRRIFPTTLAGVLWMSGGWMVQEAIAPPIAHAYVSRVDVTLEVFPGETYETLLRRAESVARAAAQRSFDRDILVSEVSVLIVGRYRGSSVQVLSLAASRLQWRSRPDPRRWAIYYPTAKQLLGMGRGVSGTTTTPPTVTSPSPPSIQSVPTSPGTPVELAPQTSPISPTPEPIPPTPSPTPSVPAQAQPATPTTPGTTPLPPLRRVKGKG